jgi:pyruvate/2-oxoglutarate/acetoin dehydrogenase E1 component
VEEQEAFAYLDAPPATLASQEHRPAYGTDGDYFSKPNTETIFEAIYNIMHERNPARFPAMYFNEK